MSIRLMYKQQEISNVYSMLFICQFSLFCQGYNIRMNNKYVNYIYINWHNLTHNQSCLKQPVLAVAVEIER